MTEILEPFTPDLQVTPASAPLSTYIVTGCAGFIGSHLAEALLQRGDAVIGIDSFTDYYPRARKQANLEMLLGRRSFVFLEADLIHAPLETLVAGVDGVFHLAAQPGVRVVYASSSSVYGNAEAYPTTELSPVGPVSPYGVTKLCCENLASAYESSMQLDAIGMRYFTVYGPRQRPDMATQRIAEALVNGTPFTVFGSGEQSRDVTYVEDVVTATIATMETAPAGRVYNVGGGSETSLRRIIELCEEVTGESLDVSFGAPATGDVRRTAADTSLIREETGWEARTSLEEGLISQLAWTMSRASWASAPAVYAP